MQEQRRGFIKKALGASAAVAVGVCVANATSQSEVSGSKNGVVKGKSPKKEILYKETKAWQEYYSRAH